MRLMRPSEGKGQRKISGQTAWKIYYEIETLDELREYVRRAEPVSVEWIRTHWLPSVQEWQRKFASLTVFVPGHGCGFHDAYGLMGQEQCVYAIHDAPKKMSWLSLKCAELTGAILSKFEGEYVFYGCIQ